MGNVPQSHRSRRFHNLLTVIDKTGVISGTLKRARVLYSSSSLESGLDLLRIELKKKCQYLRHDSYLIKMTHPFAFTTEAGIFDVFSRTSLSLSAQRVNI